MTVKSIWVLAAGVALAAGLAGASLAQDKAQDPTEKRFDSIEKQLKQLRSIVMQARDTGQPVQVRLATDPDPSLDEVRTHLDDLDQAARTRNEQIDALTRDLNTARKDAADAHDQVKALEDRLSLLEGRMKKLDDAAAEVAATEPPPPPPFPGGQPATAASPSVSDAGAVFKQAMQLLREGEYPAASAAFQNFVQTYGDTPDGPEARYWLGETLFIRGLYPDAATAYIGAIRGWPQTTWAPDAVIKLSRSLIAMNKAPDACKTLDEFARRYPSAPAPTLAKAAAARAAATCPAA